MSRTPRIPRSKEMKWLSRGLFEALVRFIGLAGDGMALRAALYEFHYQPVANAFAKAIEAGADVKIVYDAESDYKIENEATIKTARLDDYDAVIPRTVTEGIRHNKFIVLLDEEARPVAVWTGSTNISAGGIFGHSNVGHVVWDEGVAKKYLDYWQRLADNLTATKLRAPNGPQRRRPPASRPRSPSLALFSARDDKDSNDDAPMVRGPAGRGEGGLVHDLRVQHRHGVPAGPGAGERRAAVRGQGRSARRGGSRSARTGT